MEFHTIEYGGPDTRQNRPLSGSKSENNWAARFLESGRFVDAEKGLNRSKDSWKKARAEWIFELGAFFDRLFAFAYCDFDTARFEWALDESLNVERQLGSLGKFFQNILKAVCAVMNSFL